MQVIVYTVVHHTLALLHIDLDIRLDMVVDKLEQVLMQLQRAAQVLPCGAGRSQPFSAHELPVICIYR